MGVTVVRIVSVVGARPQFVKLAPIAREFAHRGFDHVVIHTGQHYDVAMSGSFFDDFALGEPDINLAIGSGSHAAQTGEMLAAVGPELERLRPDWVLVYGDTNSTLAATLAAAKLGFRVAHLEAGLRSFNRTMPEEHNRVLTDHAADLLLAPTPEAIKHLEREGLAGRSVLVGDVMADICLAVAEQVAQRPPDGVDIPEGEFILATLHRPYNTDERTRLASILAALSASPVPVVLPAHPRLRAKAAIFDLELDAGSIRLVPPLGYPQVIYAAGRARAILTDSGGLQKEAYLLGVPCTTVRPETEWVETLEGGWNMLCFEPVDRIVAAALRPVPVVARGSHYGAGSAAAAVADALIRESC
jgi:UDP-N-acetylglucosamine 2-epimerase (non-hydrolysing)